MQRTKIFLAPVRVLQIYLSNSELVNPLKTPPLIDPVSRSLHFQASHTSYSLKPQTCELKTLGFAQNIQKLYLQSPFSSKPSRENVDENSTAKGEDSAFVCRVIKQRKWCQGTENELGSLEIKFRIDTVLSVLQSLGEDPETAWEFFKWVGRQTCFKHSASTYNAMIKLVGSNKYIDFFWILINEMGHKGYQMDIKTYIVVLRRFIKRKMMKDAVDLFIWMMDNGESKPSSQNCSRVLHELSLFSSPDIDLVFKVVEAFRDGGGYLDKAVYDGIHRSLSSSGRFDEAEDVVNVMRKAGFVPDNITYSQLVYGLCKAGRLDEGCTILEKMKGLGCIPDLKTWTILIDGHCRAGKVDKALSCFRQMLEDGCQADYEVLAILVSAFCNQNRVDNAYSFLCQMIEEKSVKPSQATLKELIKKLTHAEKLPEALKVFYLMKDGGFPPFVDPFYEIYAKSGTVDRALDFLNSMRRKRIAPVKAYFAMLDAFCKAGKQIEAQDLLYKCPPEIRSNAEILSLFGSMITPKPAQSIRQKKKGSKVHAIAAGIHSRNR